MYDTCRFFRDFSSFFSLFFFYGLSCVVFPYRVRYSIPLALHLLIGTV